jgi:hypothetical protein
MGNYKNTRWNKYIEEIDLASGMRPNTLAVQIGRREGLSDKDVHTLGSYISRRRATQQHDKEQYKTDAITTDKKVADFHWRSVIPHIQALQTIFQEASGAQDYSHWTIKTDRPIGVAVVGDLQLGSWATDYDLFMRVTEEIIETPDLYTILVGDLLQMAIKLRGVLEAMDNAIPPKVQMYLLDSWLKDIKHKVIASLWDNHSVMREENGTGYSAYAEIFKRHTIFHNHIGHLDVQVNDQVYKWAVSHFFRGKSLLNNVHAPMRYMRHEAPDRDIAVQGDFHLPGIAQYWEAGKERIAAVCGSIQTESGYAKRFFSLTTCPTYPCIALDHEEKRMTAYWSIKNWLKR